MNDSRPDRDAPSKVHLSEETLEQLAEGLLSGEAASSATLHLRECGRCAAALDGYQTLFGLLDDLPRFAPSPAFADAVMARVQVAPEVSPVLVWLLGMRPTTRRGRALLAAAVVTPTLSLVAATLWLLTHPLISVTGLWQWSVGEARQAGSAAFRTLLESDALAVAVGWGQAAWGLVSSLPAGLLAGAVVFLAVAIPLSAWSLVRLVRTPMGHVTYAN